MLKSAIPAFLLAFALPASAQTVAVPETAPAAGFYLSGSESRGETAHAAATGPDVVSAADPRAAAAGLEMLQAGGNAADAALAMMITLTVVEPQSSGLGGGGFLIWHDARTGKVTTIDGRETAPAAAQANRFLREDGSVMPFMQAVSGGYSVGTPGAVALIAKAHGQWGKLPWSRLFQPAIRHAREGFPVGPRLHSFATGRQDMLRASPAAARIYLDPEGKPWPVGHVLKMPELAETLEKIAADGPDAFYKGPIAGKITDAVAAAFNNPAALTAEDLANYRAIERAPVCGKYRKWKICSMAPPSSGGIAVLQIMMQLERFDLAKLGPDNLLSQHLFAESQRLAYADREAYGADADFVDVPVQGLLDRRYIARRSKLIRIDRAMADVQAGKPAFAPRPNKIPLADIPSTSHMVAADAAGNVASLTSTIEGPFGSGIVAAGMLLNNELTDFDLNPLRADGSKSPNAVHPGKRPRSSMAPTIVYDASGNAVAAFGAAGGSTIIAQVAKAIIAHLDWNMPADAALAAPQIIADRRGLRYEQGTRLAGMEAGLKALGHKDVKASSMPLKGNALTRVANGWQGAADPRSEGLAFSTGQ